VKKIFLFIFIGLTLINSVSALNFPELTESLISEIKSVDLNLHLNENGQIDSLLIVKEIIPFNFEDGDYTICLDVPISKEETIDYNSIEIIDYDKPNIKFLPTLKATQIEPYKFEVDYLTNQIKFCTRASKTGILIYQLRYTYEAIVNQETRNCIDQGIISGVPITFGFPTQKNPYFISFSLSADKSIFFNASLDCPQDWTKANIENGFKCINNNLNFNNHKWILLNASLRGPLISKIEENKKIEQEKQKKIEKEQTKSRYKAIIDKIFIIILGFFSFIPKINELIKNRLDFLLKEHPIKAWLTLIFFLVVYIVFQAW
jgi:hypothetical protein